MKTRLVFILALSALCLLAHGQGAISFRNIGSGAGGTSVNARFFDVDGVTPLSGSGFSVQLMYGPAASPVGALTPLASPILGFNTGGLAGYFSGSPTVEIPGVPQGGIATLQVRIWDNMGGTITNFAQAQNSGARWGQSNVFQSPALGNSLNPATIPVMQGLQAWGPLTPLPRITNVSVSGGNVMVNWTVGTLETTGRLLNSGTVWTSTGDSDGSYTAPVATGNAYFRVRGQ